MSKLDKIFRAYDIRGIYPEEINEKTAYKIGRAATEFLIFETQASSFKLQTPSASFRKMKEAESKYLVIGRDNRVSSENLFKVLCEGIRDQGVNIIDIGISTTPMFYFAVTKWKITGGIMTTASHNPPQYNGFKIVREQAMPIGEDSGLEKIKKLAEKEKSASWRKDRNRGQIQSKEILKGYIENILSLAEARTIKPFKIVVDTANGTAGLVIPELFKKTSVNLIHIFAKLDGSFPNHNPNPANPENTKALQEKVLSEKADLGIAFDGDGDRIFFIDEKSNRINPNLIFALLIKNFFPNQGKILYDVTSSRIVREEIEETGNIPVCSKVGHSFVKEKMREEDIIFGAESAGHYYFKDNHFIESPFIVLLNVLGILSKTKMPLSELIKPFQKYYQERINIPRKDGTGKVKNLEEKIKEIEKKYKKDAKISYLDGLSVEFEDWWFNIRPSHTEPVIRLTLEAQTKELLEQKKKELNELLKN